MSLSKAPDVKITYRTAQEISDEILGAELECLKGEYEHLKEIAPFRPCFSCLKKAPATFGVTGVCKRIEICGGDVV